MSGCRRQALLLQSSSNLRVLQWPTQVFQQWVPLVKGWKWLTFPLSSRPSLESVFPAESRSKITRPTAFPHHDQSLLLRRKRINPPILKGLFLKRKFCPAITKIIWTPSGGPSEGNAVIGHFYSKTGSCELREKHVCLLVVGIFQNNQSFLVDTLISGILPFPSVQ